MPLKDFNILKKDWLKGYQEVPKKLSGSPNNNVRIEFNPQRSNELNGIAHDIQYNNQKVGEVSGNYKSNGDFEISDVGVDKAFQKKGISKQVYTLLNEAHPNNKVVSFGAYNIDAAGVQPGRNLWESLVKEGKAKRVGNSYEMLDSKNISSVLPGSSNKSVTDRLKQFFDRPPGPLMLGMPTGSSGNMVKKNIPYYEQLLNTYDSKVMSATNKKFYKDLIGTAKKQDGMVTEAQLRELDRLKTGNFDFGKKGYAKGGATKNFIELELPKNEIQDYINQGYIVEEVD
jgi:hypothetical protein